MRTRLGAIMIVAAIAWTGVAGASQCPTVIAKARAALEQFKKAPGVQAIKDAKIAAVEQNLRAAEGAHSAGEHDEAVKQANEALRQLGK